MIKAIEEEQKLSKSQSVKKICSRGAKITAIKNQLIPALQHTAYDSVIIHAETNDLNDSQPEDVIKGLTEMAEEAIKIRSSIKVSVSGLISQRDENADEKIMHTAISRKVVGKNVHATIPKGNMGYDQYTVPDDCSCRTYFCCFPLALANTFPWPFVPILSNFFEKKRTQNHPQCLSGLSRAVFPTTFLETAV